MQFKPNQTITISDMVYQFAEHPIIPGMPYGQEGRRAVVYQLADENGSLQALKVFKPRFRMPRMVAVAEKLAPYASLPGLQACQRKVLTSTRNAELLVEHPDLVHTVLMPWVEGSTWQEIQLSEAEPSPEQALQSARSLIEILVMIEERGLAHCDLSGANIIVSPTDRIALVDLEEMYGPGFLQPTILPAGSPGYAHCSAPHGLWSEQADRFAGAVLMAEMLGWCDPRVRAQAAGDSYFSPEEIQLESERYQLLVSVLKERWGKRIADLFESAWRSDSLLECASFGSWHVALLGAQSGQGPIEIEGLDPNPPTIDGGVSFEDAQDGSWICPHCGEKVRQDLKVCPYCEQGEQADVNEGLRPDGDWLCPHCGKALTQNQTICPYCEMSEPGPSKKISFPAWEWLTTKAVVVLVLFIALVGLFSVVYFGQKEDENPASPGDSSLFSPPPIQFPQVPSLYFTSDRNGKAEIYRLQGSQVEQVTHTSASAESWEPVFTSLGKLYFTSDRSGKAEIYRLQGSQVEQVTYTPADAESWGPFLSSSGILYFSSDREGQTEIYRLQGNQVEQVTHTPAGAESWAPFLSSLGKLYFTSDRSGKMEIYRLQGNQVEQVTYTPAEAESWGPFLSSSGILYFTSDRSGQAEIYRLQGSQVEQVTHTPAGAESWGPFLSPSGILYFTSDREGKNEIYQLKGKNVGRVTHSPANEESWMVITK